MTTASHQYIDRHSGRVLTERLFADRWVNFLYSEVRENAPRVFNAITSRRGSELLGLLNFESMLGARLKKSRELIRSWGVDVSECLEDPATLNTPEKVFTRKIRYWETRPMDPAPGVVASPADSRVILGSFAEDSLLFIKTKFFDLSELVGGLKRRWQHAFEGGDWAVFRLTPEKYHYVHTPVSGRVVDHYQIEGHYHSCNPAAVINLVNPYSKNKRVVTVIDTDVPGGTGCGLVAVVEVVALMVGDIAQCYSQEKYLDPQAIMPGMYLERGAPKSVFKPGSSTVVLLFQPGRVSIDPDLLDNQRKSGIESRFSKGLGGPVIETELMVRDGIAMAAAS